MATAQTRRITAANSDTTVTFQNSVGKLLWMQIAFTSNATVGNRQLEVRVRDAANNIIYSCPAGAVQAASLTRNYLYQPGVGREAAFVVNSITVPLPAIDIPDGGKVQVIDTAAIAAGGDSMVISYGYLPV